MTQLEEQHPNTNHKRMGTTTGWRRNTSFERAREEQEEDGYNGIGFNSKRVTKSREKERNTDGGRESVIIYIFTVEAN